MSMSNSLVRRGSAKRCFARTDGRAQSTGHPGVSIHMKRGGRLASRVLVLCLVYVLWLAGCGSQTSKRLVLAIPGEPQTLDPALMTGLSEINLAVNLFEGLLRFDPGGGAPLPGVAERFEVSPDGLVYTFRLRKCLWSNGDALTAADFAASWKRVLAPATASKYAAQLHCIDGARQFNAGETSDFSKVGVETPDDATLRVRLVSPVPYFPFLVASPVFMPVHKPTVEKHRERWTRPENVVCNGPFMLKEHQLNSVIGLARNHAYWDAAAVKLDEVRVLPIEHDETAFSMYEVGDLDWLRSIPFGKLERVHVRNDFHTTTALETVFLRLNVTAPPFDNLKVRKAFALGTDRQAIRNKLLKAGQQPARSFVPPVFATSPDPAPDTEWLGSCFYVPHEGPTFDPAAARNLLAEAGYPGGQGFPEVSLIYSTNENIRLIVELLQWQWKETLGVKVALLNMERKAYFETMTGLKYGMAYSSWVGDYPDPMTFFGVFASDSGTNRTGWKHARYDALVSSAGKECAAAARADIFRQAEKILVEDECAAVMLYHGANSFLLKEKVRGIFPNALGLYPLRDVAVE